MWLQREREGLMKTEDGSLFHSTSLPCGLIWWWGSPTHSYTLTYTCIDLIGLLSDPVLPCCLRPLCTAHRGSHTHTHRIGLQLDFKRCPWVWPHCNKTLNQPHLIYKFRAFILKKNEQRTLKYCKQVAKQALDYGYVLWHLSRDRELKRVPQLNVSWECSDDVEKALVWVWKWSHGQVTYCSL